METLLGLVEALVMNVRLAVKRFKDIGLKAMFKVHELPAVKVEVHVFEEVEKLEGLVPVRVIEVIFNVAVPEFVRVTT